MNNNRSNLGRAIASNFANTAATGAGFAFGARAGSLLFDGVVTAVSITVNAVSSTIKEGGSALQLPYLPALPGFRGDDVELLITADHFSTFQPSLMFSYTFPNPLDGQLIFFLQKKGLSNPAIPISQIQVVVHRLHEAAIALHFTDEQGYCNYSTFPSNAFKAVFDCPSNGDAKSSRVNLNCFSRITANRQGKVIGLFSRCKGGSILSRQLQRLIIKWEYDRLDVVWQECQRNDQRPGQDNLMSPSAPPAYSVFDK